MSNPNESGTVSALVSDGILLVKQEMALAQAEMEEKIEQVQLGVIAILSGLLIAFAALLVLTQALVIELGNYMPASLAALLVGLVLAILAFFAVRAGQKSLRPANLKPQRTMRTVREGAESFREAV